MKTPFPLMFSPGRCGALELPNRLVFAATSSELADDEGHVGDEAAAFYAARARGGTGLIVVEATYVEPQGRRLHQNAMLHDDKFIPGMRKLAQAIQREGAKAAIQLNHGGRDATPKVSGSVPLAPSPIAPLYIGVGEPVVPRELTIPEIQRIVRRFVEAAVRSHQAGFDAIELHGAHGYLISQFFSPDTNRRTDAYGDSVEGRARFCVEILQGIKAALGADYPVIVRMNGRDHIKGGLELEDACRIAELLQAAGADAISVSGGVHSARPYMIVPGMSVERNCFAEESHAMRARLRIPVMTVGRIKTAEMCEDILAQGQADYVCMSRALIADPELPNKARRGAVDEIVPCIACNECLANAHRHEGVSCTVNPQAGREHRLDQTLTRAPAAKTVVIAGSGAAGLSAAVTAAARGHRVHVFERDARIGGQLRLAASPPHRDEIGTLLEHYQHALARHKVDVHLNQPLSPEKVRELGADVVLMAVGARPIRPQIPGAELPHVMTGRECLEGAREPGRCCVVVGGGLVAIEVADHLAEQGRQVVLIARSALLKKAVHVDRVYFMGRIETLNMEVMTHTDVVAVGPDSVDIRAAGRIPRTLHGVDSVIFCLGYESNQEGAADMLGTGVPTRFIGDAVSPRKFVQAIEEGTFASLHDGEVTHRAGAH